MASLFEHLPRACPPMEMPYIERKQDWVTPAIEAFWKAYRESGYSDKCKSQQTSIGEN
jgi:hypothetical protein